VIADRPRTGIAGRRRTLALLLLCTAQFLVGLDFSIVNVALPAMRDALGFSPTGIGWVVSGYALAFGGFLMVGGRAADLFGRRRLFLVGLVLFGVASALGGVASSPAQAVAARFLQGGGAAALLPSALALIALLYPHERERAKALGTLGGIGAAGASAGGVLGGVLIALLGWRWVFFANVPLVALALALAPRLLPPRRSPRGGEPLDVAGALLGITAVMLLLLGFEQTQAAGWGSARSGGLVLLALALLAAFVVYEHRVRAPLLPVMLLRNPPIAAANAVGLLSNGTALASLVVLSQYLQDVRGLSPLATGAALLPFMCTTLLFSAWLSGRLVAAVGPRRASFAGLALLASGYALLSRLGAEADYARDVLPGMLLGAAGAGTMFTVVMNGAIAGVAPRQQGAAAALVSSARQIGGALGAAVMIGAAATSGFATAYAVAVAAVLVAVPISFALPRERDRPAEPLVEIGASHVAEPAAQLERSMAETDR